jgi:hypothetical protein
LAIPGCVTGELAGPIVQFPERMAALCDGPPAFHNLDVINLEER